jgi:phospholipid-binding lipoprotein MlaA
LPRLDQINSVLRGAVGSFALIALVACSTGQEVSQSAQGLNDPYEAQNRKTHEFNKALDTNLLRPTSRAYAAVVPTPVRTSVSNFSKNLSMPQVVVNSLLQGNLENAGTATFRFVLNSTVGMLGLFDAASEFKVADVDSDFGETLAVWGVGEGAFLEIPVFGPAFQRDAVGKVVDLFTNPLTANLNEPETYISPTTSALRALHNRDRFSSTIDSLLYESADSYAQTRLIYQESRRFKITSKTTNTPATYEDPYEQ